MSDEFSDVFVKNCWIKMNVIDGSSLESCKHLILTRSTCVLALNQRNDLGLNLFFKQSSYTQ